MENEIDIHKKKILNYLQSDEKIIEIVFGLFENAQRGIMALTAKRILRYAEWQGFWRKKCQFQEFPLSEISVVRQYSSSDMAGTSLRIEFNTSNSKYHIDVIWGDLENFVRHFKSLIN